MEVSIVAIDKKGDPVLDLKRDELSITDNGKSRPLSVFQFDGVPYVASPPQPLPSGVFSNKIEHTPGPPRNITAVLFDAVNTAPEQQPRAYAQLTKYVKTLGPDTRIALFHYGRRGLSILHPFTDNAENLRAKIEKHPMELPAEGIMDIGQLAGEFSRTIDTMGLSEADTTKLAHALLTMLAPEIEMINRVRQNRMLGTLSALEVLGRHLSGIPGRKNLVWIGSGFPMLIISADGMGPHGDKFHFGEVIGKTSERLAQNGVVLYIVDPRGIEVPPDIAASQGYVNPMVLREFHRILDNDAISKDHRLAMMMMASITGGRVVASNDVTDALRRGSTDLRGSYSLGFYAPDEPDGKWHKIDIRSTRPGIRIEHRQGYIAENASPEAVEWTDERWRSVLGNPLTSASIRMMAQAERGTEPGAVGLNVLVEPTNILFREVEGRHNADIEVCVAETNAQGRIVFQRESTSLRFSPQQLALSHKAGVPYARRWTLGDATTNIRVVVRDKFTGQFGTLDVPVSKLPATDRPPSPTQH